MNNESFKRDDLTRKIVKKAEMEHPSFTFTSKIMEQIRLNHSPEVFIYQPVIRRRSWVLLAFSVIVVLLLSMLMPAAQSPDTFKLAKYLTPAQNIIDTATSGFFEIFSVLHSLSWIAFAVGAGWLLFGMDKILRKTTLED